MSNDLTDERDDLIRRIDELTRTVEALEARLATGNSERPARELTAGSRRDLLRLAGTAAAGAVAGGVLASSQPAAAATGEEIFAAHAQLAANMTYLGYGTTPGHVLSNALTSEATMMWIDNRNSPNTTGTGHGIRGDGRGVNGIGLWGNSDSGGIGVFGNGGIGLSGNGSKAALKLQGTNAPPSTRSDQRQRANGGE